MQEHRARAARPMGAGPRSCRVRGWGTVCGHDPGLPAKPREDADAGDDSLCRRSACQGRDGGRAVLFWLLQPGLGARLRVARFWLIRASGAEYLDEAVQKIDPSAAGAYGETPAMVEAAIRSLGLNYTRQQNPRTRRWVWTCEGEKLPGYTARATSFEAAVSMTAAYADLLGPRARGMARRRRAVPGSNAARAVPEDALAETSTEKPSQPQSWPARGSRSSRQNWL